MIKIAIMKFDRYKTYNKKDFIMKKLFLLLGITLGITAGLQAVSRGEAAQGILNAINTLNLDALDQKVSVSRQQQVVTLWDSAVTKATQFARENCKDLLKKDDPILMDAVSKVQKVNMDFTNTIKVIRGSLANAPISRLLQISTEAQNIANQIQAKSFTLSNKKEAQSILVLIASSIASSAKYLYGELVAKK
jgi:hypothetical protein